MDNLLFCILHTRNHDNRVRSIVDTWAKESNHIFYSDHDVPDLNIYKVSEDSSYKSNCEKQVNVFKLLIEKFDNYEWYFFCDNDTFVNVKLLETMLDDFDKECVHGNIIQSWPQQKTLKYLSGGSGFLMHKDIMQYIASVIKFKNVGFSDVCLGLTYLEHNITMMHNSLFHGHHREMFSIRPEKISENLTFHYIKTYSDMIEYHEYSKNPLPYMN